MPAVKNSRSEPISRAGLAMMCVSSISEVKPSYCSRSHSFIDRLNAKHCLVNVMSTLRMKIFVKAANTHTASWLRVIKTEPESLIKASTSSFHALTGFV